MGNLMILLFADYQVSLKSDPFGGGFHSMTLFFRVLWTSNEVTYRLGHFEKTSEELIQKRDPKMNP